MKKEILIIAGSGSIFLILLLIAAFNHPAIQVASQEALHEIKTADIWQTAYTPAVGPLVDQQAVMAQQAAMAQAALTQQQAIGPQTKIPIFDGQEKPVLIKQFGIEIVPIINGKVKVTGVMGGSWADKAGLEPGDLLFKFNAVEITSLQQFQDAVAKAPPEMPYKLVYMRDGLKKKCLITVGEGEMEGFKPIAPPGQI